MVEDSAPEGVEYTLNSHNQQQDHLHDNSQNPHLDTFGLDLQAILLVLARRLDLQPKKETRKSKNQTYLVGTALTNFGLLYSNAKSIFVLVRENSKKTPRKYSSLFLTSRV